MVRIKERYLLVNILYPGELGTRPNLPDVVVLNQPTSDELTPAALLRAIRAEVAALFGDYGSGALEGGGFSVPLASNLDLYSSDRTSFIPISLDSIELHEFSPCQEWQAVRFPSRPRQRHHPKSRGRSDPSRAKAHLRGEGRAIRKGV
ncbi:ribonuclease P/MRP protein subunit [Nemania sp. FL0031]|nr:ribonuclease P/MRP protein subunit [Nemania sp. FL0031]